MISRSRKRSRKSKKRSREIKKTSRKKSRRRKFRASKKSVKDLPGDIIVELANFLSTLDLCRTVHTSKHLKQHLKQKLEGIKCMRDIEEINTELIILNRKDGS